MEPEQQHENMEAETEIEVTTPDVEKVVYSTVERNVKGNFFS